MKKFLIICLAVLLMGSLIANGLLANSILNGDTIKVGVICSEQDVEEFNTAMTGEQINTEKIEKIYSKVILKDKYIKDANCANIAFIASSLLKKEDEYSRYYNVLKSLNEKGQNPSLNFLQLNSLKTTNSTLSNFSGGKG